MKLSTLQSDLSAKLSVKENIAKAKTTGEGGSIPGIIEPTFCSVRVDPQWPSVASVMYFDSQANIYLSKVMAKSHATKYRAVQLSSN